MDTVTKYSPLEAFLEASPEDEIAMQFSDIEKILGESLPASAFKHRPWWSNNPSNSSITNAWLNAGFKSEQVDMVKRQLVFRRVQEPKSGKPSGAPSRSRHPALGILKGTIRIHAGIDLSAPAEPSWSEE